MNKLLVAVFACVFAVGAMACPNKDDDDKKRFEVTSTSQSD